MLPTILGRKMRIVSLQNTTVHAVLDLSEAVIGDEELYLSTESFILYIYYSSR
jgi:hypothetical protein